MKRLNSEEDIAISDELIELKNSLDEILKEDEDRKSSYFSSPYSDSQYDEDEDIAEDDDGLTLDDIIFIEEFLE